VLYYLPITHFLHISETSVSIMDECTVAHYVFAIWVAAMVMAGSGVFWVGLAAGIAWWLLAKKFQ
jgi:hypothetical protein